MSEQGRRNLHPPKRLEALLSWQTNKIATLGSRLTAQQMPLSARSDFAVLAALDEYGNLSQADLGRGLGLDRNDINAIVTRLEQDKRITRAPDPANRRRNLVAVTPAGRSWLDVLQRRADAVQDELLAGLSESQRLQLQRLLSKVLTYHRPQPA